MAVEYNLRQLLIAIVATGQAGGQPLVPAHLNNTLAALFPSVDRRHQ